jgi:hypothetical protein
MTHEKVAIEKLKEESKTFFKETKKIFKSCTGQVSGFYLILNINLQNARVKTGNFLLT